MVRLKDWVVELDELTGGINDLIGGLDELINVVSAHLPASQPAHEPNTPDFSSQAVGILFANCNNNTN
jgi:hypothetical protein